MLLSDKKTRLISHRPGKVIFLFMLAFPVIMVLLVLPVNADLMVEARTNLQNSVDSAALAAIQTFVDDRVLLEQPEVMRQLCREAACHAREYASKNPVLGCPLHLQWPLENDPSEDIAFCFLERPNTCNLTIRPLSDANFLTNINTVRITGRRCFERDNAIWLFGAPFTPLAQVNALSISSATLDCYVIGIRPPENQFSPFAPIALYSDPSGSSPECWEFHLNAGRMDRCAYEPESRSIMRGRGDGLPELPVCIRIAESEDDDDEDDGGEDEAIKACILSVGSRVGWETLRRQVVHGINQEDLQQYNGELVFDADYSIRLPLFNSRRSDRLLAYLNYLAAKQEPRIWPLYSSQNRFGAKITNFVAARIVPGEITVRNGGICFLLQPSVISDSSVVTDASWADLQPNRFVKRISLIE